MRRSTSVLFPEPGFPVTPTIQALPVAGKISLRSSMCPGCSSSTMRHARAAARTPPAVISFASSFIDAVALS